MITENISLPLAFGAGFISFFSPCILPMIPVYIMYVTGINVEDELDKKKLFALSRTLGFVLGFTIIFMIMGTSASFIGKVFYQQSQLVLVRVKTLMSLHVQLQAQLRKLAVRNKVKRSSSLTLLSHH